MEPVSWTEPPEYCIRCDRAYETTPKGLCHYCARELTLADTVEYDGLAHPAQDPKESNDGLEND